MQGKAWKFGDNIDTDLIIAARYLNTSDEKFLASHLMEDARANFTQEISKGDIIVAGENFGCGSSREHAPVAIKAAGIAAVIAKSYARIFYRNAFNTGLPILEIDLKAGIIHNQTQKTQYHFTPIPPFMLELLECGGLIPYAKTQKGNQNEKL